MARRPEPEAILSREELADFTRQLQRLSDDGVERIYPATAQQEHTRPRIGNALSTNGFLRPPPPFNSWWRGGGCYGSLGGWAVDRGPT
jgi:hypothetical protein